MRGDVDTTERRMRHDLCGLINKLLKMLESQQ